ncbi:FecR family protein [Sunxiuqinia dokdonensis]|uniref:Uncharacterized protein n=1 Tax=Sunxiuqinia dokdonensis TaxID=1409788 RepID=A0A0L8V7M5_9BACT|nr:FecR family protein [Sunxiuqinia dokdonensis]KOH44449.1 hypothetical protein NC99_26790 [Sunxiuqinia dokdonensis]
MMFTSKNKYSFPVLLVLPFKQEQIDQVISSYRIPDTKEKELVFDQILQKIEEGKSQSRGKLSRLNVIYQLTIPVAASLILIFLLHVFLAKSTFENDTREALSLRLPDQSRIVLSQNSTATYPKYWWKREVTLKGEAYFEVEKGNKFTVETSNGEVQVLGTRFLVSEQNNQLTVNCYEGKVQFANKKQKQLVTAGNSLQYKNQTLNELTSLDAEYPKVARFNRSFSNESLEEVMDDLGRFFNLDIQLKIEGSKHFSGTIDSADAETAIGIICRSLNLDCHTNPANQITISEAKKQGNLTNRIYAKLMTK